MAKDKKRPKAYSITGPIKSDDPLYSSGRIMLRPVRGSKQESPSEEAVDAIDPGEADQETVDS